MAETFFLVRGSRSVEAAIHELRAELDRAPTEPEISHELHIDVATYYHLLDDLEGIEIGTQHSQRVKGSGEEDVVNLGNWPEAGTRLRLQRADLKERLADAIRNLPERERLVLNLSYYEDLTLKEIGLRSSHPKASLSAPNQLLRASEKPGSRDPAPPGVPVSSLPSLRPLPRAFCALGIFALVAALLFRFPGARVGLPSQQRPGFTQTREFGIDCFNDSVHGGIILPHGRAPSLPAQPYHDSHPRQPGLQNHCQENTSRAA
jgi:hypothetical protein